MQGDFKQDVIRQVRAEDVMLVNMNTDKSFSRYFDEVAL